MVACLVKAGTKPSAYRCMGVPVEAECVTAAFLVQAIKTGGTLLPLPECRAGAAAKLFAPRFSPATGTFHPGKYCRVHPARPSVRN